MQQRIDEKTLERAAEGLEGTEEKIAATLDEFRQEQPVVLAYLTSENFEALSQKEQEYMLYIAQVLWLAIREAIGPLDEVPGEALAEAEDRNWELLAASPKRLFHERLDVFFDQSAEEDLLAFLEDALSDEEDGFSTREGREAMFVSLKSIADTLLDAAPR